MEKRKRSSKKSSPLPADYLKMVGEVFTTNFDTGIKQLLKKLNLTSHFVVSGEVFADEVMLCVSLHHHGKLAATSIYASCDFDPKASTPTIQDLLALAVDAIGSSFQELFQSKSPDALERLASESLAALENVPFDWTAVEIEKRKIYLRVDKANIQVDQMADEFLKKKDPGFKKRQEEEEKATEELFVTGVKRPKGSSGGNTVH